MLGGLVALVNFKSNLFNLPVENLVLANLSTLARVLKSFLNPRFCNAEISTKINSFNAEF